MKLSYKRGGSAKMRNLALIALTLLLLTGLVSCQNGRWRRLLRDRNNPGFPSGTSLNIVRPFGVANQSPATSSTTAAPRTHTTTASGRTTPRSAATDSGNDDPYITGKKVITAAVLKNLGKALGSRPPKSLSTTSLVRPTTLFKNGNIKPTVRDPSPDSANDEPSWLTGNVDDINQGLFNEKPLKKVTSSNIPRTAMPALPPSIDAGSSLRGGPDTGNDGNNLVTSRGHEFWIAFMDNRVEQPTNTPLEIYVAAGHYSNGVKATVKMWYYDPYGEMEEIFDQTELSSDSVKILTVPAYMKNVVNGVFKKGIRIVSDQPVTIYGFNYERFSADAFRVLPLEGLSTHYIAVTYHKPHIRTQIACTAVRDETLVRITLPHAPEEGVTPGVIDIEGVRFYPGESFNLTVNAFEVLAVRSVGDLTGTEIMATDKIACFSGNVRAHVGAYGKSRDHLAVQLMPVSSWSNSFAIAPAPSGLKGASLGETHIIVTSKPQTTLRIKERGRSAITVVLEKAKSKYTIDNLGGFASVRADFPIMVAQVIGSQNGARAAVTGDPSMVIYSGINQYSTFPQTALPPEGEFGYKSQVLIFIDRDDIGGLRISRSKRTKFGTVNWVRVPLTNIVGKFFNVKDERISQIWHENNAKFSVQYFGFADRESFSYMGGIQYRLGCDFTPMIPGDGVDNDCDGRSDEELIDSYDNDFDGRLDEDTGNRRPYELAGGTEYILTFMENHAVEVNQQLILYVTVAPDALETDVTVTITQPLITNRGVDITRQVTKGELQKINIAPSLAMITGSVRSNRALKLTATDRVIVHSLNKRQFSLDGHLVLPVDRLGTEYYTVSYSPSHVGTQFAVVATEPDTYVDIVFPREVRNKPWSDGPIQTLFENYVHTNGGRVRIFLNQYEAFQMQSGTNLRTTLRNLQRRGDLTGTQLTSNKPIAVFSGNGRVNTLPAKSRDHLVEQMSPVVSWGKEYVVTPTPLRTVGEYYRIIASQPNTKVIVDRSDGVYETFTLSKGAFNQIHIDAGGVSASIYADKPVMVVMFMKSQKTAAHAHTEPGDPAMIVIPHTEQWTYNLHFGTPFASSTPISSSFYVTVVLQQKFKRGLRLNDELISPDVFLPTPRLGRKNFVYAIISVAGSSNYFLQHDNPLASFFAQLYGTNDRESIGYVVGLNLPILKENFVYFPKDPTAPGVFGYDPIDVFTIELCGDQIDNDGDLLVDEDCDHAHEYPVMFMTNTVAEPLDHSLEIHCISSSNQNYVRLTTGLINRRLAEHEVEKNIIQEVTLNRDEHIMFTVPGYYRAQLSRSGYFDNQYKGVVVESDWALECYAYNKDTGSADGWLMKDYYDLGTKYMVSAAWEYSNRQLVGIVGTERRTEVTITLPPQVDPRYYYSYVDVNGLRYYSGETFTINLNRLQIFQLDVKNGFDLTGTYIESNRPIAVFAGNERSSIPFNAFVGQDHAADQLPKIPGAGDFSPAYGSTYRFDVLPTGGANTADLYQCVGLSAGTQVTIKQNGIDVASSPAVFGSINRWNLPSGAGPVQINATQPMMCEQFVWSDQQKLEESPELAGNILPHTYYDARPWFRFVVPKISTLAADYKTSIAVSFNLQQLFANEGVAFYFDGYWLSSVVPNIVGDQAFFRVNDIPSGPHAISCAIVDNATNNVKNAIMRFTIQVFMHAGGESISFSPVPERLFALV